MPAGSRPAFWSCSTAYDWALRRPSLPVSRPSRESSARNLTCDHRELPSKWEAGPVCWAGEMAAKARNRISDRVLRMSFTALINNLPLEHSKDQEEESRGKRWSGSASRVDVSWCSDGRQLDEGGLARCMVDTLGGFAIVAGLRPENVGHEGLGIAVVQREPALLNSHHDEVAGQEHVICRGKREAIDQRFVWRQSLGRVKALAVAATENIGSNHELITAHFLLSAYFVGVEVDELDDPIGVRAAGGGDQVGDRLSADFHRRGQRVRDEDHDVGAPGNFALVASKPGAPGHVAGEADGVTGASVERNGLDGIGDAFFRLPFAHRGRTEA